MLALVICVHMRILKSSRERKAMARRGRSTTIGKFAKIELARRVSEIRMLGELLRREQDEALASPSTRGGDLDRQ